MVKNQLSCRSTSSVFKTSEDTEVRKRVNYVGYCLRTVDTQVKREKRKEEEVDGTATSGLEVVQN